MAQVYNIRVVIVDDNDDFREGLFHFLNFSNGFEVVGCFANPVNIVENITRTQPDVVLMDIDMPHITGIEAVKLLKVHFKRLNILMLTVFEDEERVFKAMQAGAIGYLLKKTPPQKVLEAVQEVMEGGAPMSPLIARKVVHFFSKTAPTDYNLTPKELEVLRWLVEGLSYKLIAAELNLSIDTVRTHLKNIYDKLHVKSNTEAVVKAIRNRLV
ncbi:response regulator [Runella sp. CRIBMP]|uniref:Response regulator transcription factor n=1 Tax=Runella salmonicolor TaxID=2950278 RepID=A0ABT1FMG1_9BACT|nr:MULTISPECIES: response regulator transcription factor [Runella]MCP1381973.1 response regulator transcription factor [Runella salmonicolor]NBB20609.1 response regulator [Runella sp. CRIBMP]